MPTDRADRGWTFRAPNMDGFKLRHDAAADIGTFQGYLARYGNEDDNGDVIVSGAFAKSLAEYRAAGEMPPMLLNHAGLPFNAVTAESLLPIGVWTDLHEDNEGIAAAGQIDPLDTDLGKRIYAGLKNKTVRGLSIGYKATGFTRGSGKNEPRRTIHEAKLFEGSIVWAPANPLANIASVNSATRGMLDGARARLGGEDFDPRNIRHLDILLREAGLSRSQAKGVLASGFKSLTTPREAGADGALSGLLHELKSLPRPTHR